MKDKRDKIKKGRRQTEELNRKSECGKIVSFYSFVVKLEWGLYV